MHIKDYKCKCEHDDFFFADKGNQTGIYCSYCGKWLKWADKDEQNLRMKQESTLDLALLEKTYSDFCDCECGEGWLEIDGKEYYTDFGYAIDGIRIFLEV